MDAAMIQYTGRSMDTEKMPSNVIQRGFKYHCFAAWVFILAADTSKAATKPSSNSSEASRENYVQKDRVLPNAQRCDRGHMPVYGQKRVVCWLCRW
jgi:hypothetical protein